MKPYTIDVDGEPATVGFGAAPTDEQLEHARNVVRKLRVKSRAAHVVPPAAPGGFDHVHPEA